MKTLDYAQMEYLQGGKSGLEKLLLKVVQDKLQ